MFCGAGVVLPSWLSDADWRKRHAALICLAQIAEGCARVMSEQVEGLVTMCLQGLRDPHVKVRKLPLFCAMGTGEGAELPPSRTDMAAGAARHALE